MSLSFRRLAFILTLLVAAMFVVFSLRGRHERAAAANRLPAAVAETKHVTGGARAPSERGEEEKPAETIATRPGETAPDAFTGFDSWTARYLAAPVGIRADLLAEGVALAQQRRSALAALIPLDPRQALEKAVPMKTRGQLPAEVVAELEERVNAHGFLGVLGVIDGPQAIRREVRLADGRRFETFTFGRRIAQPTTEKAALSGIAVPNPETPRRALLALDERPLRLLETGERPDPMKPAVETCPVSGKSTAVVRQADGNLPPITDETPAVEIGGTIHYLCNGGHIQAVEEELVAAEGATGGAIKPTGTVPSSQSTGVRSLLYMRVAFPESNRDPQTETAAADMMKQVNDWFVENSFGNVYLVTTVTPLIILPRTEAWYNGGGGDEYDVRSDAQAVARQMGYDTNQYDLDITAYTGGPGSFGGLGYVGGKGTWLKSLSVGVAVHELGHNFGLWHANYWTTTDGTAIGNGSNNEYGNSFDTMGSAGAGDLHFNANHKAKLNWMPAQSFVSNVTASGTYRLFAFDQPRLDPANRYALRVRMDSLREYWAEFRQRSLSSNRWTKDGILLNWSPWASSNGGAQLLDTTPGSPDGKTDAAIVIGNTFSDRSAGVHLTPIGKGGTVPESIDLVVNIGTFPGNLPPTVSVAASATSAGLNAAVNFTATANDPDGDPLSYAWDFGDKTFSNTNSPAVSKSWSAAGDYTVRCTVSDMKGQTASATALITIGSPGTFRVGGQVTLGGQPLANVRVSNGQTGTAYRGAFSDQDGRYTITGLSAGSVTLAATLGGYSFTPAGFTNPVTVGPNFTNANFAATQTPVVTLVASDADANENAGNSGQFTLSRTGPTTAALAVNLLAPTGAAARTSDYTLAPDLTAVSPYQRLTIPAGQASLGVTLTPVNDTSAEGPETAVLELAAGSGYLVGSAARGEVTIQDSDTSLPVVRLRVTEADASEGAASGSFTFSRTGATTSALVVKFAVSGSATSGSDYPAIGTQMTIPAGASSAPLNITPLDDNVVEGNETVSVTISTDAAYLRASSSAENSGTINLLDEDLPTLTVVATDATAAETGTETGTFVITRTGNTTQPLTVNYALTGSALQGVDYQPLPGVLTIPAGSTVGSVTITPVDDGIGEPAQTVYLQLRGGTGYIAGSPSNATVTIADSSDVPVVTVGVSDGVSGEPADAGTFRFTTTGTGTGNITVRYSVSGTATSGDDFTALSGTLSIGRNTTANVTLTPLDDSDLEGYETVVVTITADPAYSTHLDTAATINLRDDDQPVVNVSTTNDSLTEASGTARFYFSRTGATTSALAVNYSLGGTATAGLDYTTPSGIATIPVGSAGLLLDLAPINDTLAEGTETIVLNVAPGSYGVGFSSATQYLADNDSLALQVKFNSGAGSGGEAAGTINVPVVLTAAAAGEITVEYVIGGGTATAGVDYTLTPGRLSFAPGETTKNIPLTILDDAFTESSQTVQIKLQNAFGASLGTSTFTHTINDNDPLPTPTVGFAAASASAAESIAVAQIVVSLSATQTSAVSVAFAVTGGTATASDDYTGGSGTLTFAPGETAKLLPISIVNDNVQETNDTLLVALSNASGAILRTAAHTYTITDDDAQAVTITATDASAAETAGNGGLFTVSRTGSTAADLTVNLTFAGTATGGSDYEAVASTVVITSGQTTATLAVTPLDDPLGEAPETVIATVAAGSYAIGTPSSATVTIGDNEPVLSINVVDASAAEAGLDRGSIAITRTGRLDGELTVPFTSGGTATAGNDYATLVSPVVIPSGSASVILTVTPLDDAAPEGAETVLVTLSSSSLYSLGAPASASVAIADDDINTAPVIALNSPAPSAIAIPIGVGLILDATTGDDGKPAVPGTVTTTWSKVSGPGTVAFGSAAQASTTATFSLPGAYVLQLSASDGALQTTQQLSVIVGGGGTWAGVNVNGATPAGSFSLSGGTFTVRGGGANITGTSDQFYFVQQTLTGDFRLTARVASFTGGASSAKAGLIFRSNTTAGAAGGFMSLYGPANTSQTGSWRYRASDGASYAVTAINGARTYPNWVRLTRTAGTISGETSPDGLVWTVQGSVPSALPATGVLGFGVTSNSTSAIATVIFDSVSLTGSNGNVGPLVDAGDPVSLTFPTPANLNGTVSDDDLPQPAEITTQWVKMSGPGVVTFADAAALETSATFAAPGAYVLRLIADDGAIRTFHDLTITNSLPIVSVSSLPSGAAEFGPTAGAFLLTRAGSASNPLEIHYTLGGTATEGIDYATRTGVAVLEAGQNTAEVSITPLADALAEGPETVQLTLTADPAYIVAAAAANAIVNLADLPLDDWRFARFGAQAGDLSIAGDNADPDGDGRVNWFEFALDSDPLSPAFDGLPAIALNGTDLTFTYRRPRSADGFSYQLQETLDLLLPWAPASTTEEILTDDGQTRLIRAHVPAGSAGQKLLRLQVTRP